MNKHVIVGLTLLGLVACAAGTKTNVQFTDPQGNPVVIQHESTPAKEEPKDEKDK